MLVIDSKITFSPYQLELENAVFLPILSALNLVIFFDVFTGEYKGRGMMTGKALTEIAAFHIIYILTASKQKFSAYYEALRFYL